MPTNRFYTQALPQYTSQFVEDKTPWQAMLALNQQKIGRADAALAGAAQAESQFSSILPGFHTQDIVPEVTEDFSNRIEQWQEQYGDHIYSVPAMRALTKIQGQFQSDPRVKMVQQDVQQTPIIQRSESDPNYRPETDPNKILNPETGEYEHTQFGASDVFTPHQAPTYFADINPLIDAKLKSLKSRLISTPARREEILDEQGQGTGQYVMRAGQAEVLNDTDFAANRRGFAESILSEDSNEVRYLKALHGEDFGVDELMSLIEQREQPVYREREGASFFPQDRTTTGKTTVPSGLTFPVSAQKIVPPDNSGGGEEEADISKSTRIGIGFRERKANFGKSEFGSQFYDITKEDPSALLSGMAVNEQGEQIDIKTTFLNSTEYLKMAMAEQPYTTMRVWEEFWDSPESEDWIDKKEYTNKIINRYKEQYKVGEPKFDNAIDFNKALNIMDEAGVDLPLDQSMDHRDLSYENSLRLREVSEQYQKDVMGGAYRGEMSGFNEDYQEAWSVVFGGVDIKDGKLGTKGGMPEQFRAATIFSPDDPKKGLVTEKTKRSWFEKDKSMLVTGTFTNETSQYGAGAFTLAVDGENYIIRGPKETVEPYVFNNVINSVKRPQNNYEGDFFAYRGLQDMGDGYGYEDIVYRWNEDEKGNSATDVWMNVAVDKITDPINPHYVLRVYQDKPNKEGQDHSYLNPYKPEGDIEPNPKGYYNIQLTDKRGAHYTKNYPPPDDAIAINALVAQVSEIVRKGILGLDAASEQLGSALGIMPSEAQKLIQASPLYLQ